jgi:hypothetical protein
MAKRLIVCCDGTWNTSNWAVRGDPSPTNVSQMAGRSRTLTGRNATTLLLRGGVSVDRWERLRGGAFGFGLYKVRNAYASWSTTTSRAMRSTCSSSARSPRAARLASSATQRASAASTPRGLTRRTSYTAATDIRAPPGPLVPRCVLPPDTHPSHPRLGQGRALGIPISGSQAVNLVNRWWQFHDTQLTGWVDAALQALAIDEERSSFGPTRGRATHGPTSTSDRCGRRSAQRRRRRLSRPCAG